MAGNGLTKKKLEQCAPGYKLGKQIGQGGNGVVFKARGPKSAEWVAIKFFRSDKLNRYARFRDEVKVLTTRLKDSPHAVPVLDSFFPGSGETSIAWYAMPLGTPAPKQLADRPWVEKIAYIHRLAEGLAAIHSAEVAHRDIKPDNLLFLEGQPRFADFGLAKFPESSQVTRGNEPMGPVDYLAPEMRRDSNKADPYPADVYSFCKTIWALLTQAKLPFAGQYAKHDETGLEKHAQAVGFIFDPLEDLLSQGTDPMPDRRPTASQVVSRLAQINEAQSKFAVANVLQWQAAARDAINLPGMTRAEWRGLDTIFLVLAELSRRDQLNHCILPGGGGIDISSVSLTEQRHMLSLEDRGFAHILRPESLVLELFPDPEFNFAVLTASEVTPLGSTQMDEWRESLIQFEGGREYGDPVKVDVGDGQECVRYFRGGRFVVFAKMGVINSISYTALEQATVEQLRLAIEKRLDVKRQGPAPVPSLRQPATRVVPAFRLHFLDEEVFERLLDLDKKLYRSVVRKSNKSMGITKLDERMMKKLLKGPSKNEKTMLGLIESLSRAQLHELMALVMVARGNLPLYMYETHIKEPQTWEAGYVAGIMGNGYLSRATKVFKNTRR